MLTVINKLNNQTKIPLKSLRYCLVLYRQQNRHKSTVNIQYITHCLIYHYLFHFIVSMDSNNSLLFMCVCALCSQQSLVCGIAKISSAGLLWCIVCWLTAWTVQRCCLRPPQPSTRLTTVRGLHCTSQHRRWHTHTHTSVCLWADPVFDRHLQIWCCWGLLPSSVCDVDIFLAEI